MGRPVLLLRARRLLREGKWWWAVPRGMGRNVCVGSLISEVVKSRYTSKLCREHTLKR